MRTRKIITEEWNKRINEPGFKSEAFLLEVLFDIRTLLEKQDSREEEQSKLFSLDILGTDKTNVSNTTTKKEEEGKS